MQMDPYKSLKGEAIERKKHGQYKEAYQNFVISRSGSVQPDGEVSAILVHLLSSEKYKGQVTQIIKEKVAYQPLYINLWFDLVYNAQRQRYWEHFHVQL